MRNQLCCWTSLFCVSVCSAVARQDAVATPSPRPPIALNVVVSDKSGKPVSGLQQQDFTLLDNKSPQPILSFQAVTGAGTTDPPVEVILLIDEVNVNFTHVAYTRDQVQKFLKQNPELPVPVSLAFFTDSGTTLDDSPTRDGNALIGRLNDNKNALRSVNRSQGFYGADERLDLSLKAIDQLTETVGPKPGRKLVIWIGPGWPLLSGPNVQLDSKIQDRFFNSIVRLSTILRQANITLYSVDPLGTSDDVGLRTSYYEQFLKGITKPSQVYIGNLAQQVLSRQSGGLVLNSNNDVAGEITKCLADATNYYIITFEGLPGDGPNEYHALQVKVDKPGLTARTRYGYYAQPTPITPR